MENRCFQNPFPDFDGKTLLDPEGKLLENLRRPIQRTLEVLLERLYTGLEQESDDNYSVYTGTGGGGVLHNYITGKGLKHDVFCYQTFGYIAIKGEIAVGISLLHLHLYRVYGQDQGQLDCAIDCLKRPLRHLKGRRISFLCGDAGPLALASVIYHKLENKKASNDCIKKLEAMHQPVCEDPSLPDELLYGRAGYLYALLFVNAHFGEDRINASLIEKVVKVMMDSGIHMSQQQGWRHPLMYAWHEKHYLGAAHGLAGIFFLLMQVKGDSAKKYIEELVRPSVEYMLTLRFPSGNCPSSLGSSTGDKLIHWCHGAPGWVHMFIMAYQLFKEDKYLQAAKDCADVTWSRGLLTKGYGICHGVAGNAYAFLSMYQLTDDQKYLYRAYKFAEWCFDYGRPGCKRPDTPYSLFEGLAGTIYFLSDMLDPKHATFPAFHLP